jgi:hypothetical protein
MGDAPDPAMSTPSTGRIRMIGFVYAKEGMSEEDFHARWYQHGELIRSMPAFQKNVLLYEQVRRLTQPAYHVTR